MLGRGRRRVAADLSPRWGLAGFRFPPTACAVGCILPPLRGWFIVLANSTCAAFAGGDARATRTQGWAEFEMFDEVLGRRGEPLVGNLRSVFCSLALS
jgi:hypothetical protein